MTVSPERVAEVARGLSPAQRNAVLSAIRKATGASGERWTFPLLRAATRKALIKCEVASPWGMVSADLTPLGIAVRNHIAGGGVDG